MSDFLRQLRGLPHSDKLRFCGIIFSVLFLKVFLRIWGFKRTVKLLKKFIRHKPHEKRKPITYYRFLLKLCYGIFRRDGFCLPVSLVFWWMLQTGGIEAKLYFGMRKEGKKLIAHAWLEHDGVPIIRDANVEKNHKSIEISVASGAIN